MENESEVELLHAGVEVTTEVEVSGKDPDTEVKEDKLPPEEDRIEVFTSSTGVEVPAENEIEPGGAVVVGEDKPPEEEEDGAGVTSQVEVCSNEREPEGQPLALEENKVPDEEEKENEAPPVPLSQQQPSHSQSRKPRSFRPPVAKSNSSKLVNRPSKLTKQDVMCPICWTVLYEPTTLPCNHSLCTACFLKHVDETSLCCPCCRRRVSVWSRKAKKKNELIDSELWTMIKNDFPDLVEAKMQGKDSPNSSPTSSAHFESLSQISAAGEVCCSGSQRVVRDAVLNLPPGEIFKELKEILVPHEKDMETQREQEEAASSDFIQKLQIEEAIQSQVPPAPLNREEEDYLLAYKLQQEWENEDINRKTTRNLKTSYCCRNLLADFEDIGQLTPSEDEAACSPVVIPKKRKPKSKKASTKKAKTDDPLNPQPARKTKPSATVTSTSTLDELGEDETTMTCEEGSVPPDDVEPEQPERFTFSPFSIKLRMHTDDYIPSSAEKKQQPQPPLSVNSQEECNDVLVDQEDYFFLEKEARMLESMRKKVEQEEADRALAERLQQSYDMGIDNPRGRHCLDEYSIRNWRKNKK